MPALEPGKPRASVFGDADTSNVWWTYRPSRSPWLEAAQDGGPPRRGAMNERRIVQSMVMSAALALGVTGCPPEPPVDNDAGIGGSAPTGGTASGGIVEVRL